MVTRVGVGQEIRVEFYLKRTWVNTHKKYGRLRKINTIKKKKTTTKMYKKKDGNETAKTLQVFLFLSYLDSSPRNKYANK